jgi:hypothetical protein
VTVYFRLLSFICCTLLFSSTAYSKGTLKGFVKDKSNGETIPYANVVLESTTIGDVTDENGYYVIPNIPNGTYLAKALMIGYNQGIIEVTILNGQTITTDFYLEVSAIEMEAIVKTADRERFERQVEPSTIQISPREIKSVPAFVEADLFRSLQMLPGVVTRTDFSSALYIRGGNPSENIILLDDVRIYNPYHLGGIFSTFNTDAIKNVDVSVGGFPPRYGNAISSVISITNKDGNSQEFEAKGSVSLLSSKITLEHPIPNGSILISGRRTYFDYLYNSFIKSDKPDAYNFPYYFYDFHGKINYEFSPNSKITLSGFYGNDVVRFEEDQDETNIQFGNSSTTLKWRYIFNPKLFSEIILATSRFRTFIKHKETHEDDDIEADDTIHDLTFKSDMTYFYSDKHEFKFGLDYQKLDFTLFFKVNEFEWLAYRGNKTRYANFYSTYFQDDWKITPLLNIQSGLRLTYYDLGTYWRADPRIGVRYRIQDNINLKGSFGVFHQYFYTFNPEDFDYIRLVDLWFPIDNRYQPIRAIHYIAGLEYWLNDDYSLSIEGYYKDYDHLLDLNEISRADTDLDDFLKGWGYASGIEFLLRKKHGKMSGWLGYSLAFTERTIESAIASNLLTDKNFETKYDTFYPNYDRRHNLTAVVQFQPGKKWNYNLRFTFASGLPETPTVGWKRFYEIDGPSVYSRNTPIKAAKNSERLPPYIRLDLSVMRAFKFKHWSMQPFLQIINATNHHNIFLYDYELSPTEFDQYGEQLDLKPQRKGVIMFPFLPTIGINFEF